MLGARRQLAVAQRPQFPAHRLFGDGDAKLLEHPLAQIDKTPAHEAVRGWDRPAFDHGGERRPVCVVEWDKLGLIENGGFLAHRS